MTTSTDRCSAAHPDDLTPCDGPPVVTVLDRQNAGATGCEHHAARLLASLEGGRVYRLPDAPDGAAIRVFKAADGIRPFPWATDAPRTVPSQLSHAENRKAVVEHARSEGGDDYGYAFTVLADALKNGADPQAIRAEVPRVLQRVRAADIVNRIWQARDAAEGPWAEILDIVLAAIDEGADPGAVCERTLALFEQVRAESAGGAR